MDESEKEAEESEVDQMNEMNIEKVIGKSRGMLPTFDINTSQDNAVRVRKIKRMEKKRVERIEIE